MRLRILASGGVTLLPGMRLNFEMILFERVRGNE